MAYYNGTSWTYTWAAGRRLMSAVSGSNTINFSYNEDGSRASKTVNGTRHNYTWDGQTLVRDYYGNTILDFAYDANGQPYSMHYNSTPYFYILNLQGDVIRMVDGNGNTVASYEYDPYGRVISATGSMADINPLRYRGYYYDSETKLYHLWSRYYDPQTGRFISADSYASTGAGIVGNNMFAYCNNNPTNYVDASGNLPVPFPSIADYYIIHKKVQYEVAEEWGYAIEVFVSGPLGRGFLDLYDGATNQYYEVKSSPQVNLTNTTNQLEKYDESQVKDWRFSFYDIDGSPQRGTNVAIAGEFEYSYWDVVFSYHSEGMISYTPYLNQKRYMEHMRLAIVALSGFAAGMRMGGSQFRQGLKDFLLN